MIIAIACDHAGFPLKQIVVESIHQAGYQSIDLGTDSTAPVDYPDYAEKLGKIIVSGKADRGILLCGSGVGACIAANKITGVYASVCHDTYSAHQGVEHDNMNVLCLGARIVGDELAAEIVKNFLSAEFLNSGNYLRRFEKIQKIENKPSK